MYFKSHVGGFVLISAPVNTHLRQCECKFQIYFSVAILVAILFMSLNSTNSTYSW